MNSFPADLLSVISDGLALVDRRGRIRFANEAFAQMLEIPAAELVGHSLKKFIPQGVFSLAVDLPAVLGGQTFSPRAYHGVTSAGHIFNVELSARAITLQRAKPYVAVVLHSTAEKQELLAAVDEAREATRNKSIFLASMSHEIRTPLHGMLGVTGLLLESQLTDEQREYVEIVRASSESLLTIINNLLDFSKIEAGKLELETAVFDLRICIEGALDLMTARAAEKQIELAYFIEPNMPEIYEGDESRLRQVLANLIHNAIKFTDQGEIVIEVGGNPAAGSDTREEDHLTLPSRWELHFSVRDTGIGISADKIERLFQPYVQADSSTSKRYGGTGLGLVVSRQLCELMGGKMWVESEGIPGQGSTFHFTILAEEGMTERAVQYHQQPQFTGKRILIVDDNATNRMIISHYVQMWGAVPHATGSAREALNWVYRGEVFDLAVLDARLPEIEGVALAEQMRNLRGTFPMVLLSGIREREGALPEALFAGRVNKPVKLAQLYEVLSHVLTSQLPVLVKKTAPYLQFDAEMGKKNPLRILLAEDNAINQRVVLLMLSRLGYQADSVGTGLEAVKAVQNENYDVILMDVQMPELDGEEATRRIRTEIPQNRQPYIVALTADAMIGRREYYLSVGMDDYLSKPMSMENLVKTLSHYWSLRQMAASSAQTPAKIEVETLDNSVIQRSVINEWVHAIGSPSAFSGVIEVFLTDSPRLIQEIMQALENGDWKSIKGVAHALKSGSGSMGALHLSELLSRLEQAAARASTNPGVDEPAIRELCEQIRTEYTKVNEALHALNQELRQPST